MSLAKMNRLIQIETGYDNINDLTENDYSSASNMDKGICMNKFCDYTTTIEQDNDEGYCEECETNTVKGFGNLVLENVY